MPARPDCGPSLFKAPQGQLGLKLEVKKVPTEVFVVDHIEKATRERARLSGVRDTATGAHGRASEGSAEPEPAALYRYQSHIFLKLRFESEHFRP